MILAHGKKRRMLSFTEKNFQILPHFDLVVFINNTVINLEAVVFYISIFVCNTNNDRPTT